MPVVTPVLDPSDSAPALAASFRMAGIYSPESEDVRRFITTARHFLRVYGPFGYRLHCFPEQSPVVAVLAAYDAYPAVALATQPDGSFAVVDGEIFRHDGPAGGRRSDAVRLLGAYRRHGSAAFATLDAAAALTVWDAPAGRLTVARDPVGNAPCFYAEQGKAVLWASDLPTLIGLGVRAAVDPAALDSFLARGFIPAPLSFAEGVRRIPPGHALTAGGRRAPALTSYYRPTGQPALPLDDTETTECLGHLLGDAVAARLGARGRPGLLLSGGVDSKLLLALMATRLGVVPETFTFHYRDYDGRLNEGGEAAACAAHFGAPHRMIEIAPLDVADRLDDMLRAFGEPFSYGLHSFQLQGVRAAGITDLLCGTGADGFYLGNRERRAMRLAALPGPLLRAAEALARRVAGERFADLGRSRQVRRLHWIARSLAEVLATAETGLPVALTDDLAPVSLRRRLVRDRDGFEAARRRQEALAQDARDALDGESRGAVYRLLALRFFGAEMMQNWNHWASRAQGIALRAPYYDRRLVDLLYHLPMAGKGKPELRRLAATLMPREMAYQTKVSQSLPIGHWFRGPLSDFLGDQLSHARLKDSGLFEPAAVNRLIAQHESGAANHEWRLWTILAVLTWQRAVLNAKVGVAGAVRSRQVVGR